MDMKLSRTLLPVGALALALGVGAWPAEAGQRDSQGRDRNGRESQGQVRQRGSDAQRRDEGAQRAQRDESRTSRDGRDRAEAPAPAPRASERAVPRNDRRDTYRNDGRRGNDSYRYDPSPRYRYEPGPRYDNRPYGYVRRGVVPVRPRHYYGSGGNFSVYFGLGNGYLYGSPWSGRVYGYAAPRAYGARIYYGDVRLQVRPRDAAVYVDGYYAGVVDDFDGVFQRLTLEVGPHQLELDAPGFEPQYFDIYVDPAQTVNVRTDLYR